MAYSINSPPRHTIISRNADKSPPTTEGLSPHHPEFSSRPRPGSRSSSNTGSEGSIGGGSARGSQRGTLWTQMSTGSSNYEQQLAILHRHLRSRNSILLYS